MAPPPPPKRSPIGWIIAIIVVVLALIVAGVVYLMHGSVTPAPTESTAPPASQTAEPPTTTAKPAPGTWASIPLVGIDDTSTISYASIDGIAFITTPTSSKKCDITAVDLVKATAEWTISSYCDYLYASPDGLVAVQSNQSGDRVQVIDIATGAVTAKATLGVNEMVLSVGGGIVYSQTQLNDPTNSTGCARDMTLGPCLWKKPGNWAFDMDESVGIFGDNSWINTSKGVLDLHTGAPAKFGSGYYQCNGPTRDHILCIGSKGDSNSYQQVDITTGKRIGPVITPQVVVSFSAQSSVYVMLLDASDSQSHIAGYSWDTGQQVFDNTLDGLFADAYDPLTTWQAGTSFWADFTDPSGAWGFAAFSLTSGAMLWHELNVEPVGFISVDGQSRVYILNVNQLTGYDTDTVQPALTTFVPDGADVTVAGNHVVALDKTVGTLQVLNT